MFDTARLYRANKEATAHKVVNQGGTSSGKTYSIMQTLSALLCESANKVCTVVGQDIPNLKKGAMRDMEDIIRNSEILAALIKSWNKSDRIYEFHNGSIMEFSSYESSQDAKSGKRDYLFINEANGLTYPVVKELVLRTRIRCFFDYNPNSEFWIHTKVIGQPDVQLIISDHRQNPYLPDQIRFGIEALKQEDLELWKVYARGKTGKIEGLIFTKVFRAFALPEGAKYIGTGMDFGFTNDPTTAIDVYLSGGELYCDEVLFDRGLTNEDIATRLKEEAPAARWRIVADSSEPKSIEELRRYGLAVEGAQKGPDSINAGIQAMKRYKINLLPSCVGLKKEMDNYKWKVDRLTNEATNAPVDAFNHGIDAVRYLVQARLQAPPLIAARATARSWKK